MTQTAYSTTTKTFHWLTALLILTLFPLGMMTTGLPATTDAEIQTLTFVYSLHKTLGIVVFFVALARIGYALTQTKPAGLHPDRKAET
ncbi:MAG: cytochrome b/b6 domain-containing protein, partial [Yoonia sp.]